MPLVTAQKSSELLEHADAIIAVVSPLVLCIIALSVWAFKKQGASADKIGEALEIHIKENDDLHDKLFSELRVQGEHLAKLQGTHDGIHSRDKER